MQESRPESFSRDADQQMAMSSSLDIKFASILNSLIDESSYKTNRRPIWEAVGVSSAALSQYTLGHSRPRFEALVTLADFFGVTLDYLVMGREAPRPVSDESKSITRYVDFALNDLQTKVGRRSWLTARVGQMLMEKIEEVVDHANTVPPSGIITVDDAINLERHALTTYVWNIQLEYDVIDLPNGEVAAGRFAHVLAANLMANPVRPYCFMLFERSQQSLADHVRRLRKLLREDFGVPEDRLRYCQFRTTKVPLMVGTCLYKLDLQVLQHQEPALALAVADHISPDGKLGFTSLADDSARAEILLSADRISSSFSLFEELWKSAESSV